MAENKEETYIIRAGGKNKLTGTKEFLEGTIAQLGLPYRWSNSREEFIEIKDMHMTHLINSLKEDFTLCSTENDILFVMNGAIMNEFNSRIEKAED